MPRAVLRIHAPPARLTAHTELRDVLARHGILLGGRRYPGAVRVGPGASVAMNAHGHLMVTFPSHHAAHRRLRDGTLRAALAAHGILCTITFQ